MNIKFKVAEARINKFLSERKKGSEGTGRGRREHLK
jgi:hypothetical protein